VNLFVRPQKVSKGLAFLSFFKVSLFRRHGNKYCRTELPGSTCLLKNLAVNTYLLLDGLTMPAIISEV